MKRNKGQILIIGIIFMSVILIVAGALFSRVTNFLQFGANALAREQATQLAEAGIDYAIWELNETAGSNPDEGTEIVLGSVGTFRYTVEEKGLNLRTITSTGYTPNISAPTAKRTVKVDAYIDSQAVSFRYAVQVGNGGVIMRNNSIIDGSVYSNKTGESIYGGNGTIDGDAYTVGTIASSISVSGDEMEDQPPSELPTVDYQYWRDEANINNDPITCSPTCNPTGGDIGPQKYVGNVIFDGFFTMNGPIFVTGNITLANGAQIQLNQSFGSNGTVMLSDGKIFIDNNAKILPTSATPKGYVLVVTTSSADTNQDNCAAPGSSSNAICIDNNGVTAVFYALEGGATLDNNAGVTSLVAKTLYLDNSAELHYETGLAGGQFSSGPSAGWLFKKGTYRFTSSP